MDRFDRDTDYWNEYYLTQGVQGPSLFAQFIFDEYMSKKEGSVIELGCGNGRDSIFFLEKGIHVTAVDASEIAIAKLKKDYCNNSKAEFICGDFVNIEELDHYDYCYSRFSMHAISDQQEIDVIKRIKRILKPGGSFFIEVRSIHDEMFGQGKCVGDNAFIKDDHYRRFIRMSDLLERLEKMGFIIDYAAERRGFAPYKNENPYVIRIVANKRANVNEEG